MNALVPCAAEVKAKRCVRDKIDTSSRSMIVSILTHLTFDPYPTHILDLNVMANFCHRNCDCSTG